MKCQCDNTSPIVLVQIWSETDLLDEVRHAEKVLFYSSFLFCPGLPRRRGSNQILMQEYPCTYGSTKLTHKIILVAKWFSNYYNLILHPSSSVFFRISVYLVYLSNVSHLSFLECEICRGKCRGFGAYLSPGIRKLSDSQWITQFLNAKGWKKNKIIVEWNEYPGAILTKSYENMDEEKSNSFWKSQKWLYNEERLEPYPEREQ